jgi:hypothetical protein
VADQLSLELIEQVAEQEIKQLQADALRTIRKRDSRDEGLSCLSQIEGIERLVRALKQSCNSSYYRQLGLVGKQGRGRP